MNPRDTDIELARRAITEAWNDHHKAYLVLEGVNPANIGELESEHIADAKRAANKYFKAIQKWEKLLQKGQKAGMLRPFDMRRYIHEVRNQCEFSLTAYRMISKAQEAHDEFTAATHETSDEVARQEGYRLRSLVFLYIHSFLLHMANVSKLFFCAGKPHKPQLIEATPARAKVVREEFERVLQRTPALSRTLRDHLEHYDERLDL